MPVDCINQMLMTSVRGVEVKTCGISNQKCPYPGKCLQDGDPNPRNQYQRNRISYDVQEHDEGVTVQVGSALWERVKP